MIGHRSFERPSRVSTALSGDSGRVLLDFGCHGNGEEVG
jgi:hypothetical protein